MTRPGYQQEVFWAKVYKTDTCWLWAGTLSKGYGKYGTRGEPAHRVAYKMEVGPIPGGMELDHLCRTPACVNPDHLEPVTRLENMRRRYAVLTHCKHGHEFTPENTYLEAKVGYDKKFRRCRTCIRAAVARYKARVA